MTSERKIKKAITEALSEGLGDGFKALEISLATREDYEDEEILEVRVVYSKKDSDALRKGASALARHVVSKLESIGENRFPLLSLITESDAKALRTEAA